MECVVIAAGDLPALTKLIPQWEALAAIALEPNPFFEHWLLLPALAAYSGADDVRIFTVMQGGKLCGLFPFRVASRYRGVPARLYATWRSPHCLLGTPLVARDCGTQCLLALFEWLRNTASLVEFSYVTAGRPFHQALVEALSRSGGRARVGDVYTRGLLCRDDNAETYIQSAMSSDSRQKLRRTDRRLSEQGEVTHRVLTASEALQPWIDDFLRVEASGWKGASGTALGRTETDRRFANDVFTSAFERGQLVMVGIDLDGRAIARYCGFVAGEGAFAFKTAYDEAYRRFAPGLLAELDMIRAFHALPNVTWMDSITGQQNSTIDRLWKHRLVVQRLEVGVGVWGEFVVLVLLPLLQWTKRTLQHLLPTPRAGAPQKPQSRPVASHQAPW